MEKGPKQNPEIEKNNFRQRYDAIMSREPTVEGINSYADKALEDLISLIDDIRSVHQWDLKQISPGQEASYEDEMLISEGLPTVQEMNFDHIENLSQDIHKIDKLVKTFQEEPPKSSVILPTKVEPDFNILPNDGSFEKAAVIPKTQSILFILQQDFDIDVHNSEQLQIFHGALNPNMMRQISYDVITVPELDRAIFSCNEDRNATYIFDTNELEQTKYSIEDLSNMEKPTLNMFLTNNPSCGIKVTKSKSFFSRIQKAIEDPAGKNTNVSDEQSNHRKYLDANDTKLAPTDYLTLNQIANDLNVNYSTVERRIKKYKNKIGSATRFRNQENNVICEYYSPEQTEKIRDYLNLDLETAPSGYLPLSKIMNQLKIGQKVIKGILNEHIDEIGEPHKYRRGGSIFEYYSPEQIDIIATKVNDRDYVPPGYMNKYQIQNNLEISQKEMQKIIKQNNSKIGDPSSYVDPQGRSFDYYSPKQIDIIHSLTTKQRYDNPPSGYLNAHQLSKELNHDATHIEKIIREHKKAIGNSTLFRNQGNRILSYYSPEQIEVIKNLLVSSYFTKKSPNT